MLAVTATGRRIDVMDPSWRHVSVEDIARSLSRTCRFAGHLRASVEFYSVAQHSVVVSNLCDSRHALIGLLHDAAEAYVGDIIRPLKSAIGGNWHTLEREWSLAIGSFFGLSTQLAFLPIDVVRADERALVTEWRDVIDPGAPELPRDHPVPSFAKITPLLPNAAYALFMERLTELGGNPRAEIT